MKEEAVLFGQRQSLVGIITEPPKALQDKTLPAILFLNAGIIHRVGPHRLYVKMARWLASVGFVSLRFDFSGIGDSQAYADDLSVEQSTMNEAQEAMQYLSTTRGMTRFLLIGICSGAGFSFRIACCDARVTGVILINAQAYQPTIGMKVRAYTRKFARYYWKVILYNPKTWFKVIKKRRHSLRAQSLSTLHSYSVFARKRALTTHIDSTVEAMRLLRQRGVDMLSVYSERETGLDYLYITFGKMLEEFRTYEKFTIEVIPHADHIFTLHMNQEALLKVVEAWIHKTYLSNPTQSSRSTSTMEFPYDHN